MQSTIQNVYYFQMAFKRKKGKTTQNKIQNHNEMVN